MGQPADALRGSIVADEETATLGKIGHAGCGWRKRVEDCSNGLGVMLTHLLAKSKEKERASKLLLAMIAAKLLLSQALCSRSLSSSTREERSNGNCADELRRHTAEEYHGSVVWRRESV